MDFDFTPYFKRYEAISAMADQVFDRVREKHPEEVRCKTQCADCCYALFDLTLIEALYINHHFNAGFDEEEKERLLESANRYDRKIHKIKRKAYKSVEAGEEEAAVLESLAAERERCPMLDAEDRCRMYGFRPITCRLYGIPTAIGGKGHTCGKSGFVQGKPYQTVNIDSIQKMLYDLSAELVADLKSRHIKLAEIIVPLSMAILTDYNEEYLGTSKEGTEEQADEKGDSNE